MNLFLWSNGWAHNSVFYVSLQKFLSNSECISVLFLFIIFNWIVIWNSIRDWIQFSPNNIFVHSFIKGNIKVSISHDMTALFSALHFSLTFLLMNYSVSVLKLFFLMCLRMRFCYSRSYYRTADSIVMDLLMIQLYCYYCCISKCFWFILTKRIISGMSCTDSHSYTFS